MTSMTSTLAGFCATAVVAVIDSTSMPSMVVSTSARSTSPSFTPSGTREEATTPLGSRAPAARHVQVSSLLRLVSWISMRRLMALQIYSPEDTSPFTWVAEGRTASVDVP